MPNLSWSGELLLVPNVNLDDELMIWSWGSTEAFEIVAAPSIAIARLEHGYTEDDHSSPVYVVTPQGIGWLATDEMEAL